MAISIIFNEEKFVLEILNGEHKNLNVNTVSRYLARYLFKDYIELKNDTEIVNNKELKEAVLKELRKLFTNGNII